MDNSKYLLAIGAILSAVGFSLAITTYLSLGYMQKTADVLLAPELMESANFDYEDSSERMRFLKMGLEMEREQSVQLHATLMAQLKRERRSARDNSLLWFASILLFAIMAGKAHHKPTGPNQGNAA